MGPLWKKHHFRGGLPNGHQKSKTKYRKQLFEQKKLRNWLKNLGYCGLAKGI